MRPFLAYASVLLLLFNQSSYPTSALPLSTKQRWIVDETGKRTKLACVNWPAHLEPMVAEGLSKQPLDAISKSIASMGFNCVRLTWPVYLATDDSLANVTVGQSFKNLGLTEAAKGIQAKNPDLVNLALFEAYKAVVSNLAKNNIMVILDNHVSKPGWCCEDKDGNGFFGDEYFNSDDWIKGLTKMATVFKDFTNVVGMSLRNELRGPRQNVDDWYRYMQMGAESVHSANPNVLVILSGLDYDTELDFVANGKLRIGTLNSKLVFEMHWYAWEYARAELLVGWSGLQSTPASETNKSILKKLSGSALEYGNEWEDGNPDDVCSRSNETVMKRTGFLVDQGWPLLVSEWGADQRGSNTNDNRYLGCIMAFLAAFDLDWAIWGLQGSYYLREGTRDADEVYGMLTADWSEPRNPNFIRKIAALQSAFQGSSDGETYNVLFHPSTGQCVATEGAGAPLLLGPCKKATAWTYTQRKFELYKSNLCLKATGEGKPVELGHDCDDPTSTGDLISRSGLHVSPGLSDNNSKLCLDIDSNSNNIVTNLCTCLHTDKNPKCDPESQWFTLVKTAANV